MATKTQAEFNTKFKCVTNKDKRNVLAIKFQGELTKKLTLKTVRIPPVSDKPGLKSRSNIKEYLNVNKSRTFQLGTFWQCSRRDASSWWAALTASADEVSAAAQPLNQPPNLAGSVGNLYSSLEDLKMINEVLRRIFFFNKSL